MQDTRAAAAPPKKVADMTACELMDEIETYGFKSHGGRLRNAEPWRLLHKFAQLGDDAIALACAKASATGAVPE